MRPQVEGLQAGAAANTALLTDTLGALSTEVLGLAREAAKEEVAVVEAQLALFAVKVRNVNRWSCAVNLP